MVQNNSTSIVFDTTKFNASVDKWVNSLDTSIDLAMRRAVPIIQEGARTRCKINEGELKNNIKIEYEKANGLYTGKIYVSVLDVPYVMYVYYGTGKYATNGRSGNGRGSNGAWFVPASKVTKDVARYSGWELMGEGSSSPFYIARGQTGRKFLHEGMGNTKAQALDTLVSVIKGAMGG